jgi:predicted membrane chloride channel (bestrophin family)
VPSILGVLKQNGAWNRYWQGRRARASLLAVLVA